MDRRYPAAATLPRHGATRRPRTGASRHDHAPRARTRVDDYEWLRAKDDPDVTAYLEAENAWTAGADRAPGGPAPGHLRRDQGPHPRDRPLGADPHPRATGTTAARSRAASTAPAAASRSRDEADWTPPQPAEELRRPTSRRCPARSCCSTSTSWRRATTSSRSAARRSAPTRRCWPTRPTPRATSATRSGSRTCAPASCSRTRSPASSAGSPGTRDGRHLYYTTVDETWRADKIWRHRLGTAQADDELVHHEEDGAVLGRVSAAPAPTAS